MCFSVPRISHQGFLEDLFGRPVHVLLHEENAVIVVALGMTRIKSYCRDIMLLGFLKFMNAAIERNQINVGANESRIELEDHFVFGNGLFPSSTIAEFNSQTKQTLGVHVKLIQLRLEPISHTRNVKFGFFIPCQLFP